MPYRLKKSITLAELLLAAGLLSLIVLAAFAFNTSSAYFLKSSDIKAEVLNEATRIMEHVAKNALCSHGNTDTDFAGIRLTGNVIEIRQDVPGCNLDSLPAGQNPSPENYQDDHILRYDFDAASHQIRYYPEYDTDPNKVEILSEKLISVAIITDTAEVTHNSFIIRTVLMKIPGQPEDPKTNPRVELETRVYGYGISLN